VPKPPSSSDITFALKIGHESYFQSPSRVLSTQTPTGYGNKLKISPGGKKKKKKGLASSQSQFLNKSSVRSLEIFGALP
jgi:hypothetical protein